MNTPKMDSLVDQLLGIYSCEVILKIIEKAVDDMGVNKLARLSNLTPGAISNIMKRKSLREDTARKILIALEREKPYMLKAYVKQVVTEVDEWIRELKKTIE